MFQNVANFKMIKFTRIESIIFEKVTSSKGLFVDKRNLCFVVNKNKTSYIRETK